jgi:luciferase family oxidoreductase group 1
MPQDMPLPPIWLLGSSGYSAQLSAQIGVGFAFAHHFASHDADDAMLTYRHQFRPGALQKPHAILATAVVCADTDEEANRLASTVDLNFVRRARGEYLPLASPEEAALFDYAPVDLERIRHNRTRLCVGSPDTVRARLNALIEATQADELMVTTMVYDHAARRHSYELLAEMFELKGRQ